MRDIVTTMPKLYVKKLLTLCIVMTLLLQGCKEAEKESAAKAQGTANTAHDHSKHQHGQIEANNYSPTIPSVSFTVTPDAMSGWNVHIKTENFSFAPEKVNQDATANEGHAHIYVDGYKIARLYGAWYHLKKLTPGEHTVTVSLNANDHSEWSHQGKTIKFEQTITQ